MNRLRTMNPEQMASLLRTLLQVAGAIIGTWGFMSDSQWAAVSGGVFSVLITIWGIWARSDTNLILSAAAVPAVKQIVAPGTRPAENASIDKVKNS